MQRDGSILKYIKNLKGNWAVLALAIVGVMLLVLGSGTGSEQKVNVSTDYFDAREKFKAESEEKISRLCTRISGDASPAVTVTLECGEEYVYAKRSDGSYITSQGGAVLLCAKSPRVCGVAVVCRNGDDAEVKNDITSLVCALLGIGSNRVFVSGEK